MIWFEVRYPRSMIVSEMSKSSHTWLSICHQKYRTARKCLPFTLDRAYGSCPEYLKGFIKLVDHGRNTCNSNNTNILKVPKTNLKLGEKSFKFRASALWNGLNINIKNADNIDVFKQRLMKHLKCDIYNCDKFCLDLPKYYNE